MHGSRNDAQKFFQKIKRMSEASFCKDQDGNMVTDIKSSPREEEKRALLVSQAEA